MKKEVGLDFDGDGKPDFSLDLKTLILVFACYQHYICIVDDQQYNIFLSNYSDPVCLYVITKKL